MTMRPSLPASLALPRPAESLHPGAHRLLMALRATAALRERGENPIERATSWLGGERRAAAFLVLLAHAGAAWPEPLAVHRMCCQRVTPDEGLILDCIALAAASDRVRFDRHTHEMLGSEGREALWRAATRFVACCSEH
jgi:hypothetical protein